MSATLAYNMEKVGPGSYFYMEFMRRAIENRRRVYRYLEVHSETLFDDVVASIAAAENMDSADNAGNRLALLRAEGGEEVFVRTRRATPNYYAMVAADSVQRADTIIGAIAAALPPVVVKEPNVVPIRFWAKSFAGASYRIRHLATPDWDGVVANYSSATREELTRLMTLRPPMPGGRIILWHGDPGTGKSYGIRALAYEWRRWCDISFILDPETLFGDAGYMMSVIFDSSLLSAVMPSNGDDQENGASPAAVERWHLLIMEDADEFLTVDAKQRQGQSMARLLNMADGLIGQGVNLLILVTTNEPIGRIHPALARPGRCMANLEFLRLTLDEAKAWLREHSLDDSQAHRDMTLAELYALGRDEKLSARARSSLGFVGT